MSRILYVILYLLNDIVYNNVATMGDSRWDAIYYIVQYSLLIYLCISGYKALRTKKQKITIVLLGIPFLVPLWAEIASLFVALPQYIEYVNGEVFDYLFSVVVVVVLIISLKKNV